MSARETDRLMRDDDAMTRRIQRWQCVRRVLLGLGLLALVDWTVFGWRWRRADGTQIEYLGLGWVQTVYAPKYRERRFHSIDPGMDWERVIEILGWPVELWAEREDGEFYRLTDREDAVAQLAGSPDARLWWSREGPGSKRYRVRMVRLEKGVVVDTSSYLDWGR